MEELDHLPTEGELSKAIDSLACAKAPGKDGIPPELLKQGKLTPLQSLHKLLCLCWEQGHIPQDMRDANIVTLYKNKVDRSDCNNYRGISLLSIVGKVFARVALNPLQKLASRVYPESQYRQVHREHDLLPPSAAGEVSRAAAAIVHRVCGPDQSLRLG